MSQFINKIFSLLVLTLITLPQISVGEEIEADIGQKDEPAFLSIGAGYYDFNRKKETGKEFRAEYRSDKKLSIFRPFAAFSATNTSQGFIGAGILLDIYVGQRFVLTPSFAPHYYWGGNKKLDLGHSIEFRSQMEFAYRLDNRSRLGMAISHYSNAGIGSTNPWTETVGIYFSVPLR